MEIQMLKHQRGWPKKDNPGEEKLVTVKDSRKRKNWKNELSDKNPKRLCSTIQVSDQIFFPYFPGIGVK